MDFSNFSLLFILITLGTTFVESQRKEIVVGGLFHGDDYTTQIAFKYAIERINAVSMKFIIKPKMFNISRTDSFKAQEIVCQLASKDVAAIFGPSSVETSGIVSSIASTIEIPHLIYHWKTKPMYWQRHSDHGMTLNLYPDSDLLAEALAVVLVDFDWKSYTIIYENKENLIRLKDILQIHEPDSHSVTLRQLDDNFGLLLKDIRTRGEVNIIIDISTEKIIPFLKEAAKVKMLTEYNNYFITNLDTHTLNLTEILLEVPTEDMRLVANITTLRIVNQESVNLKDALKVWRQREGNLNFEAEQVPVEAGLVDDAVQIYYNALNTYSEGGTKPVSHFTRHYCDGTKKEVRGYSGFDIGNFLRTQTLDGITGLVEFTSPLPHRSNRTQFRLEILGLSKNVFGKIGSWDTESKKVKYDREIKDTETLTIENIQSKKFKIVVKKGVPFLTEKPQPEGVMLEGNARYEGYVVDLVGRLQQIMKFKQFELELVPDGNYGNFDQKKKKWDGIVQHLLERKADLGIADLTMTYERKTAVDFTMPFMTLGIGILFTKPPPKEKDLFSFLMPFTTDVWIYTGIAYISVSFLVFILSRINNDDWESSHPCEQNPEEVESIWNISNCVWLAMGSIMGQGCDILPKGSSTRIVTGTWYFFALIMLASYTANLAAFLTMDRMGSTINSAEDLASQVKIKYGTVKGGSTIKFFQKSNFSTFERMWAQMESDGDIVHTGSNDEGVARVKKEAGKYAFLMESVPMEYRTIRECTLQRVGELLDNKGYGIALPMNSPYRKQFTEAILKLSEAGTLNDLKYKWWNENVTACEDDKPHDDLGIGNVGGVFLVLVGGCFVALIVAIIEFLWNVEKIAIEEKISPWDALKSEVAFAFNFFIVTKPVRARSSEGLVSRKSSLPRSLKSRSRLGSESRSLKNKSMRSLDFENGLNGSNSRSLLNLN